MAYQGMAVRGVSLVAQEVASAMNWWLSGRGAVLQGRKAGVCWF